MSKISRMQTSGLLARKSLIYERLNVNSDWIDLDFIQRERTPQQAVEFGIQMHLAGLSLSNTVSVLEGLGVKRVRSTIHNWVHKADLQPDNGGSPNQVAVDETMIRFNGRWYWLYMAVDPDNKDILYTKLQPTRNHYTAKDFMLELIEKHDLDESLLLVDGLASLHQACRIIHSDFGSLNMEIGTP
jgi:transposase-like protein